MCFLFSLLVGTLFGMLPASEAQTLTSDRQGSANRKHHTAVKLLSSVQTIKPGTTFAVGILMSMDPGWHTYWKYSGEAGLPTRVHWKLPEGFSAGEIQWPLPHKYNESGDVLTYGYADENMLLVDVQAPANVKPGTTVNLHADVEWLECEHICVPGSAAVDLALRVASSDPQPANKVLFDRYQQQIPVVFSTSTPFSFTSKPAGALLEIRLKARAGGRFAPQSVDLPDLYPEPLDELAIGRTVVSYDGNEVVLRVPMSAYEKTDHGLTLRGVVVYQMEGGDREAVTIEVPLSAEFVSGLPVGGDASAGVSVLDQTFVPVGASGNEHAVFFYLLFAFLGGILLNVMPCVLPVIALKIFGLVKMAGDNPRQVKKLGVSFSLGILASFLALAILVVLLQTAGHQVGWGFQFQEPLFVIAMCAIVFAFGLSLFGVYEIGLPSFVSSAGSTLDKKKTGRGYLESFSEGVFATILATPCTAPFLGAALGFAFSQPPAMILLIFATAATGMALPYLLITAKPAWMKFLPKPGQWMETVKQFMGFLMMATLVWLLYVLGKQLGMEAVVWVLAFLLAVGVACWLVGRFATLVASRRTFVTTWISAIIIAVAGYWIFVETILDVRSVLAGESVSQGTAAENSPNGIQWRPFSIESLNTYLQDGKTVFVDFTAEWCLTCKVNEKTVLADEQIIRRFASAGIVAVRADWTSRNPDITRLLAKFGRSGVPLYVIFPAGKPDRPIVLPEVITTGIVLDAIASATSPHAERIP